ncbi:MAG: dienelactone hydrolase family protein [Myxococcota bacterium]
MNLSEVDLGFLAVPDSGDGPGVVMIHDVWGLADHTRDLAARLASEGFVVLAIDLYRRESSVEIANPGAWMRALSDPQVLGDLREGARYLATRTAGRVGVVGFCMGGSYALMAACSDLGFAAAVPFYGLLSHDHGLLHDPDGLDPAKKPEAPLAMAPRLGCPLLAYFGAEDEFVPVDDVRALEAALPAEPASEIIVVPDAGHAFMNDTRPDAHRPEAATAAWSRTVGFLRQHLAG